MISMSDNPIVLLAGLGNPGAKYARTRHNVGFRIIDSLAGRFSLSFDKSRFDTKYSKGTVNKIKTILVKPQSFMNRSGFPLRKIAAYFKINTSDIIVVHDDLDLEFGKIKIVKNRGHGGHNGIKSIIEAFGTKDFIRVRVGIGRPHGSREVIAHVLSSFENSEEKELENIVEKSVDSCLMIMEQGFKKAMTVTVCNNCSQS